jgi:hypothetical protein
MPTPRKTYPCSPPPGMVTPTMLVSSLPFLKKTTFSPFLRG